MKKSPSLSQMKFLNSQKQSLSPLTSFKTSHLESNSQSSKSKASHRFLKYVILTIAQICKSTHQSTPTSQFASSLTSSPRAPRVTKKENHSLTRNTTKNTNSGLWKTTHSRTSTSSQWRKMLKSANLSTILRSINPSSSRLNWPISSTTLIML